MTLTKAYQVFKGDLDKHCHQQLELVATYFDKQKAFDHAKSIAESTPLYGDVLEESGWYCDGTYFDWNAVGWETVIIARLNEIRIQ
jgi:hypothetical protein